jgi:hypothetical protein
MSRKSYGNQYIGKTWRKFKTILSGTWIGVKEMYHKPGKVALAILMLGLAFNTFMELAPEHKAVLIAQEAWADLTTIDTVYIHETATAPSLTSLRKTGT